MVSKFQVQIAPKQHHLIVQFKIDMNERTLNARYLSFKKKEIIVDFSAVWRARCGVCLI
jgi:hypothetical protein